MTYIPNTDVDRRAMLDLVGVPSMEALFADVPADHRFPALRLPAAVSEMDALRELEALATQNDVAGGNCFLGAGAYRHFIPSIVDAVVQRGEFLTAYTPYQPEVSQGTLQAHFEFQSMLVELTGMETAIVSHYDGATAAAEAAILALSVGRGKRSTIVVSPTLHPQYREVIRTYTEGMGVTVIGDDLVLGDIAALGGSIDKGTACVLVQNPDFLGRLYTPAQMQQLADAAHASGALFAVSADPISLGLFQPPGAYGADVAVGEGQPLGNPVSFGGPYLGLFATKMALIRKSSGRLVGQTTDVEERRGFTLTLSSREQHIRREKASSNICSNQALNAVAAAVYLAAMGKHGLRQVAELCYHKAHYAAMEIGKLSGYEVTTPMPFFREFAVRCPRPVAEINRRLREGYSIIGGYALEHDYPALADQMLICVTEMHHKAQIDALIRALEEVAQ